jgi:hypothetical protein
MREREKRRGRKWTGSEKDCISGGGGQETIAPVPRVSSTQQTNFMGLSTTREVTRCEATR